MRPQNLLIIMSDQHSRALMGCYGHALVRTPQLDRLAARCARAGLAARGGRPPHRQAVGAVRLLRLPALSADRAATALPSLFRRPGAAAAAALRQAPAPGSSVRARLCRGVQLR